MNFDTAIRKIFDLNDMSSALNKQMTCLMYDMVEDECDSDAVGIINYVITDEGKITSRTIMTTESSLEFTLTSYNGLHLVFKMNEEYGFKITAIYTTYLANVYYICDIADMEDVNGIPKMEEFKCIENALTPEEQADQVSILINIIERLIDGGKFQQITC